MYQTFDWSLAPGRHGYQRACELIRRKASIGLLRLGQDIEQDGAADRSVDRPYAPDVDHDDDVDREDHREQIGADLELIVGVKHTAESRESSADHQRGDLIEGDVDACGLAARLVAANGAQQGAPGRVRE